MIYFAQCQITQLIRMGLTDDWEKTHKSLSQILPTPVELLKLVNLTNASLPRIKAMFATQKEASGWFKPTRALIDFINLGSKEMEQELRLWSTNHPAFGKTVSGPPLPKFEFAGYTGLQGHENVSIACCRSGDSWKDKYAQITWRGKTHLTHWSLLSARLRQLGIDFDRCSFWWAGNDSVTLIQKPAPHKGPKSNRLT